jgi:hypothetical protein
MKTLNYPLNNKSDHNITDYLMFQKTVLKINIHYSSLLYEYMQESPMIHFNDFILDVGYTFGLFFGMKKINYYLKPWYL